MLSRGRGRIITCPGCDGDGCCVCDHEGRIYESALGIPENGLTYAGAGQDHRRGAERQDARDSEGRDPVDSKKPIK